MYRKIIIVTGKAQSGKNSTCNFIRSKLSDRGLSSELYAFADPLKEVCVNFFGLDPRCCWGTNEEKDKETNLLWKNLPLEKETISELMSSMSSSSRRIGLTSRMTSREIMQVWGTNIFRKFNSDCWVNSTLARIRSSFNDYSLVCDARFPNEIDSFQKYEPLVIKLTRNVTNFSHASETVLDDYDWRSFRNFYIVDNSIMSESEQNSFIESILESFIENNDNRASPKQVGGVCD